MNAQDHFAASLDSLQPLLAFVASSDQREEFARIVFDELERSSEELAERQFLEVAGQSVEAREGAIRRALLTPAERSSYYAEFMVDDLARADLASRFDAYAKAITNGLLSPNEVRAAENRAPYAGGDKFRLPLNTADANTPMRATPWALSTAAMLAGRARHVSFWTLTFELRRPSPGNTQ